MWHASIAHHGQRPRPPGPEHLDRARRALRSVGDPAHEWEDLGLRAVHVRRRLNPDEIARTGLTVRDVRGTPEAERLLDAVRRWLPSGYTE